MILLKLETITLSTALKMTFSNNNPVDVRDAYVFLAEYAAWLLGCGATCIRITKNVIRIAEAWNLKTEIVRIFRLCRFLAKMRDLIRPNILAGLNIFRATRHFTMAIIFKSDILRFLSF